ncbi:unnamed protein product, partial [Sphacelaria rigidula]
KVKVAPAPPTVRPTISAAKETAEESIPDDADGEKAGIWDMFGGMFATSEETFYDDELDTLPEKTSSPRAMPVFSPPPAPPMSAAAKKPAAVAPAKQKPEKADADPLTSVFGGLFGGGSAAGKGDSKAAATPAKVVETKPKPAATPTPAKKDSKPAFDLFGMMGGAPKAKDENQPPTPPAPTSTPPRAAAVSKAKAPAPAPPAVAGLFDVFGASNTPPRAAAASKAKAPAPAPPAVPGLFDVFGASKSKKSTPTSPTSPAAATPAPAVAPKKLEPAKKSSPFAGLFGGGSSGDTEKAKPAAPKPKPKPKPARPVRQPVQKVAPPPPAASRVKKMDDAFLKKVSVMLRGSQVKIKKFQQLTDRFRGGLIKAPAYYEGVEELFGEANVE